MATLIIPEMDEEPWPTLGFQLIEWIEENLVYGPGDMRGQRYKVDDEFAALLCRAYEIHPPSARRPGRRRFKKVGYNVRKGLAKTEKGGIIAACELHPDAPVRCDGFDAYGEPVGRGVIEPYVAMVAYTKDQTEELGYNVLKTILEESSLADDFDIGLERILLKDERGRNVGKAVPLTGAPGARDGARTTHNSFDETHRMTSPRLIHAHTTMEENTYKRQQADAWTFEGTTMFDPTEQSVAADTHHHATEVHEGRVEDSALFYIYRYAPEEMPLTTINEVTEALIEASGPAVSWSGDIEGLAKHWFDPKCDQPYYRRVWLNQKFSGGGKAFDSVKWTEGNVTGYTVAPGSRIAIGFDGSKTIDSTALICVELSTGYSWVAGLWEKPVKKSSGEIRDSKREQFVDDDPGWEVDPKWVEAVLEHLFATYDVTRMYGDPYYWTTEMDRWRGLYGEKRVLSFETTSYRRTGLACASLAEAIRGGQITHPDDERFAAHIGNSVRQDTQLRATGDDGEEIVIWTISKERRGSPKKIDAAMALVLAWEAANDAIASGANKRKGFAHSFD